MNFPPAALRHAPVPRAPLAPRRATAVTLAGRELPLDRGGFHILTWPDEESLRRDVLAACAAGSPVVRFAGGALMEDLTLRDNLYLEPALDGGILPDWLEADLEALFEAAGAPLEAGWSGIWPDDAAPRDVVQVRIGRALAADPDILLVDAVEWDDAVIGADLFTAAFLARFPWRALAWVSHDAGRSHWLGESLQEFQA